VIELHEVSKSFDGTPAVDQVSLDFAPGKVTGFLGPNGAGKTTTIRMIMNIIIPDSGQITAGGSPLGDSFRNLFGYLPEERGMYKKMKVIEHLIFFGTLKGMSRRVARERSMVWLTRLELGDRAGSKVEDLSKGMQQKIQFIGSLLHEPELVLLDEPFSGLDPINTEVLRDIMLDLKEQGKTVIFSTHMMEQAEQLCDDIILMDQGRVVLSGGLTGVRSSFGKGHLRVRYSGDGAVIKNDPCVSRFVEGEPGRAELSLHDEKDVPRAIREWSSRLEITHFEVITPSLHNIFIQTVKKQKAQQGGNA
jgi:ABC-2 type transport system ATP-binding protein